jgi:2-oxoglutarate dehydrogenase E2 component (dihydrolipoamide succinyltransferase)
MVPVLLHCQNKSITEIAKELSQIVTKARDKKLSIQEMQKGSITLTNFGMTGILLGLPIIRFPEVAIVAAGSVEKQVRVIQDQMVIRSVMMVTLTFDHRVIDGIYGCQFLKALQQYLEEESWKEIL